jgi:hypothetical protein
MSPADPVMVMLDFIQACREAKRPQLKLETGIVTLLCLLPKERRDFLVATANEIRGSGHFPELSL